MAFSLLCRASHPDTLRVIPGLVPGIHVLSRIEDVDGGDEPGHDGEGVISVSAVK